MSKQRGSQPVVRDQGLVACDTSYNAAFYVSCHPHRTRYCHSEGRQRLKNLMKAAVLHRFLEILRCAQNDKKL